MKSIIKPKKLLKLLVIKLLDTPMSILTHSKIYQNINIKT